MLFEWVDGEGNTAPTPTSFLWPEGLELPRVGDHMRLHAIGRPFGTAAEVVSRQWSLAPGGPPALRLTCDLGPYSGSAAAR